MSGTAVDAALAALVSTFTAAAPTGWQVLDAQPTDPKRRFVAVGWDASGQPAVIVNRVLSNAGGTAMYENVDVSNVLTLWSGKELSPQARSEALAAFDLLDAALAADRQLSNTAMLAAITAYEFTPAAHPEGVMAQVRFTVTLRTDS